MNSAILNIGFIIFINAQVIDQKYIQVEADHEDSSNGMFIHQKREYQNGKRVEIETSRCFQWKNRKYWWTIIVDWKLVENTGIGNRHEWNGRCNSPLDWIRLRVEVPL